MGVLNGPAIAAGLFRIATMVKLNCSIGFVGEDQFESLTNSFAEPIQPA